MLVSLTITTSLSTLPLLAAKLKEVEDLENLGEQYQSLPAIAPATASVGTPATVAAPSDETPASLTDAQARLFLQNCSAKTLSVLRVIVDGREFPVRLSAIAEALGFSIDALGWVWGGLTKRTRNVLGDPKVRLIVWRSLPPVDGKWEDSEGMMAETTVAALRNALGIAPATK